MNPTALVTGASSGIGFELARVLARNRNNLILVARNADKLNEIKKEFESEFQIKVTVIPKDLSHHSAPQEIFEIVQSNNLIVDILINNAGVGVYGPFSQTDWDRELEMLNLNMITLTHLTKLFVKGMLERKNGKILNVASTAAFQPGPLMALYYASKSYVLSFSEALRNELQGSGVTVTTLCPGATKTEFQTRAKIEHTNLIQVTSLPSAEQVAQFGYEAMMKGKGVVIHGFMNRVLVMISKFLPRNIVLAFVRKLQETRRTNV